MRVPSDKPPVALELLELRSATAAYLSILADVDTWAEAAAGADRQAVPEYAEMLDRLRDELRAARNDHEMGTPAMILRVVAELLGEVEP